MDNPVDIDQVIASAVWETLGPELVARVSSEPRLDWTGDEGLSVMVVLKDSASGKVTGDQALNNLVLIQDRLQQIGDDRFAIVRYATESELEALAGSGP